jgi:thioredoxin 1
MIDMAMTDTYAAVEPARADIDALKGPAVLEFGAPWCPHCQAVQPLLSEAFSRHSHVQHIKVEDGKGKPLGRSFQVKLWPALIFLDNGKEVTRLVRPTEIEPIQRAFLQIDPSH